jgi:hypothetical protein
VFLTRISALTGGLVLLAGTLAGGTAQAAEQQSSSSSTVMVGITAAHNVVMPTTVQPGVTTFRVTTEAKQSGFQLVQLADGYSLEDLIRDVDKGLEKGRLKAFRRFEANTTLLGGVNVANGRIGKLTLDLEPGSYYAADIERNRPSAFTAFTVAGADTGAAMPAGPTVRAIDSTTWSKKTKVLPRRGMLTFQNFSDENHFVVLAKLGRGKTVEDFGDWVDAAMRGEEGPPPISFTSGFDSGVVSPGHTVAMNYRLPKGSYVLTCFWSDADMRLMPHAFMGMYRGIEVR